MILIAPWWPHNPGFHIYCVFVYTTLSSFHTAVTYCHNRDMSRMPSRTVCMLGGSHAALPSRRIFEEVSRLTAVPKRPSTYRVYDDRWLHFTHWAAGQGIDPLGPTAAQIAAFLYYLFDTKGLSPQSIKGYRSCLDSVLSRTGMAAAVQTKTMSDIFKSMELQRPRMTPVPPQWGRDIILEALSKPPYVPLGEVSLKHLTMKTFFLPAMASAGRCRELQALVFDPQYIQFKHKGPGYTMLYPRVHAIKSKT